MTTTTLKHAAILPEEKTLCGLESKSSVCSWVFTENDMKLSKGQQYSLFREMVSCESCLEVAKNKIKDKCEECGQEI